jgi:hypothetical protein
MPTGFAIFPSGSSIFGPAIDSAIAAKLNQNGNTKFYSLEAQFE